MACKKFYLTDRQISRLNKELALDERISSSRFGEVVDLSKIKNNQARETAEKMAAYNARPEPFWHKTWNGI